VWPRASWGRVSIHAYLNGEDMKEVARRLEWKSASQILFDIVPYNPRPKSKDADAAYEDRARNFPLSSWAILKSSRARGGPLLTMRCSAAGQCDLQKYSIEHGLADKPFS